MVSGNSQSEGKGMKLSAGNIFRGTVTSVKKGAINSEVTIGIKGWPPIAAIIANTSADNLGLKVGGEACAIIKASSIIIGTDLHSSMIRTRNIICGSVTKVVEGPVNAVIAVEIDAGNVLTAIITNESVKKLMLKAGDHACAMFKASSVILGV